MTTDKYYDWQAIFSKQAGNQDEFMITIGAKDTGKNYGLWSIITEMHDRYINDVARHLQMERCLERRLEWYRQRCAKLAEDNECLIEKLWKFEQIRQIMEG